MDSRTLMDIGSTGQGRPRGDDEREHPSELGRFLVLRQAGAGGMGVVYVAYDPELDRKVAVKLLHPNVSGSDREANARVRLIREAKALARLSHPNVVSVYDVGTYRGRVFIAMEFIQGVSLSAWLFEERRAPAEVVARLVAAGRGLAAAHREGLVHGDFKPDNILVDEAGRVRVVDFGLASAPDEGSGSGEARRAALSDSLPIDLSARITRSGAFAGTPAYLAPEQFDGAHRSARSDQFSFCVSLYEGLYGARPFAGEDVKALRHAIWCGPPPEPRERAVPAWLRRIVLRGLSVDPAERFPDMDALLAALERDPSRRRRRIALGIAVAAAIVVAALAYRGYLIRSLAERQGLCAGAQEELVGVWDPARRRAAEAAFLATGLPYAVDAWERTAARLDARADAWVAMHGEACRATHLRGEQSAALLDLRMACLQRRLVETRSLVDVLADADAGVVENAAQAVERLGDLDACADAASLLSAQAPARSEAAQAAVAELRELLARARALEVTARLDAARALAEQAVGAAEAVGEGPLIAEALLVRGRILEGLGDPQATAALRDAFFAAEATRDDVLPARAALELMHSAVQRLDLEGGEMWSRHLAALTERLGDARPSARRTLEAEHASVLGTLHVHAGRLDAAESAYRRALALSPADDDADHRVAGIYNNLGNLHVRRGALAEAAVELERSAALYRELLGAKHPRVAIALNNLGELALRQGAFAEADAAYREAREILVAALGPRHPNVGVVENNLGDVAIERREHDAAIDHYERARAIFTATIGEGTPPLAYPLTGLAEAKLARGEVEGARALLEEALPLREGGSPQDLAHTRFALARALVADDRGRAAELAAAARRGYAEAGPAFDRELQRVDRWVAAHPPPARPATPAP
ncbi:MAG: tetratricopeptide repeat protein [Nannocystaceae bacterium]